MRLPIAGLLIAGLTLALVTAGAQAQQTFPGAGVGDHAAKAAAQADKIDPNKLKANEKAYNAALRNLPDKQYDPWHGVR